MALQHKGLDAVRTASRGRGLGAGLQDVERAVGAVLGPFDVHRGPVPGDAVVMGLDRDAGPGEFQHVRVRQAEARPVRRGRRFVDDGGAGVSATIDQAHLLAAEPAAQDTAVAGRMAGLVDIELVRIDVALHHVLAQAPGRRDEGHVGVARFGVQREHDTGGGLVAAHHLHHRDRQRHLEMVESPFGAVGNGAVGEQRGLAPLDSVDQHGLALDVEVGVVLPCKAGAWQVLGGGRTAYGHAQRGPAPGLERPPGFAQPGIYRRRHGSCIDDVACLRACPRQRIGIARVQIVKHPVQRRPCAGCIEHLPVGICGDAEPIGDADAQRTQVPPHLAQRSGLAAHQWHVGHRQFREPTDVGGASHGYLLARHAART